MRERGKKISNCKSKKLEVFDQADDYILGHRLFTRRF